MTTDRSTWVTLLSSVALASAMLVSNAARAQGAPAGSAMEDEARRLYDEARKAKEKGDHETCVAKMRAAWALKKHRQVAGLLGECELRTGAHRDAAEHLGYFLDHAEDASPEVVTAVRALYDEARVDVAVVTLKASAPGADRKVDGRALVADEAKVYLSPGEHVFAASKVGSGSAERRLFVAAGEEREVLLELGAPSRGDPPPAVAPTTPPPETRDEGPSIIPGLVLGGVGLVGVGVGVALLVAGGSAGSDADAIAKKVIDDGGQCDPAKPATFQARCEDFNAAASDEATLSTVGAISLIGGGVLLAGGVVWTVWAATSDSDAGDDASARHRKAASASSGPRITLAPSFGPSGAGLRALGSF